MRALMIAAAASFALAGCSYRPEMMARVDDLNVCRLSTSSLQESVAKAEIAKRGLDCQPYLRALAEQGQASTAATLMMLGAVPTYQPPPPAFISCSSTRSGASVSTTCY